jgi:hypothetical protein
MLNTNSKKLLLTELNVRAQSGWFVTINNKSSFCLKWNVASMAATISFQAVWKKISNILYEILTNSYKQNKFLG